MSSNLHEVPRSRETVSQDSLRILKELFTLQCRVRRDIEKRKAEIVEKLLADAEVEPGMHTAELIREWKNGTLMYSLEVY